MMKIFIVILMIAILNSLLSSCNSGSTSVPTVDSSNTTSQIDSSSGHLQINGLSMYYEIYGKGDPLVLVHGGGSSIHTTFGAVIKEFAKTHKVIGVDLQAHGLTSDRNSPSSFQQDADDVAALLKQLNIAKADFFGFSNGGSTVLQIGIRHPEIVNKIIAASAIFKREGMIPGFWEGMQKGTINDMPQSLKDAYLKLGHTQAELQNMHDRDAQRMRSFADWKDEDIRSIKAPTLVISSEGDVVRPEHSINIYRLLQHGKLIILPGSHGAFLDEISSGQAAGSMPQITVSLVNDFLNDSSQDEK